MVMHLIAVNHTVRYRRFATSKRPNGWFTGYGGRWLRSQVQSYYSMPVASNLRPWPSIWWWLVFSMVQTAGYVVPQYANVHSNPTPLLIGMFLLAPGCFFAFALPRTSPIAQCVLISGVNLFVWYLFWRRKAKDALPESGKD
jgi:hypothetical protein